MKECTKCKEVKELEEFYRRKAARDGRSSWCKVCHSKKTKAHRVANPDKYRKWQREWYKNNHDYCQTRRDNNRQSLRERSRERYWADPDKFRDKANRWARDNREKLNNYRKARIEQNSLFKTRHYMRNLIRNTLRNEGYEKKSRTHEILGCSYEELQTHLIQTFEMNYCIEYSPEYDLHIDHIYPVSLAKSESELIELNHYSNLQLLFAEDNLKKSNRLEFTL